MEPFHEAETAAEYWRYAAHVALLALYAPVMALATGRWPGRACAALRLRLRRFYWRYAPWRYAAISTIPAGRKGVAPLYPKRHNRHAACDASWVQGGDHTVLE
jgi:hypothetical protein